MLHTQLLPTIPDLVALAAQAPHTFPVLLQSSGSTGIDLLLALPRRRLKVRELVHLMEQAIIDTLADYGLAAERKDGAPGVYIAGDKIAALGLRVRNGCSYHGLAINVDADLAPFGWINPCGYEGLKTIRMKDFGIDASVDAVGERLLGHLQALLPPIGTADAADQPPGAAAGARAGP